MYVISSKLVYIYTTRGQTFGGILLNISLVLHLSPTFADSTSQRTIKAKKKVNSSLL